MKGGGEEGRVVSREACVVYECSDVGLEKGGRGGRLFVIGCG